jgi:hypothetical protein
MEKNAPIYIWYDSLEVRAVLFKAGGQLIKSCQCIFCFLSGFLGNFQKVVGKMLSEISKGRKVKPPSEIYRPGDLLPFTLWGITRNCALLLGQSGFKSDGSRVDLYSKQQPVVVHLILAIRSAVPPIRLETQTKESNMYASQWVDLTCGAVKAKSCLQIKRRRANRRPAISNQPPFVGNTQSTDVGTQRWWPMPGRIEVRGKPDGAP